MRDHSAELNKLRGQLNILHDAQTEMAKTLVTEYFYSIHKNYEQIHLNRERLASLRKSEKRLEAKRQVGPIKVEEVLMVKSEMLKARSQNRSFGSRIANVMDQDESRSRASGTNC